MTTTLPTPSAPSTGDVAASAAAESATATPEEGLTALGAALRHTLDGRWREAREHFRASLDPEQVNRDPTMTMREARDWTDHRLATIAAQGHAASGFPEEVGGLGDPGRSVVDFEMSALTDLSLTVKSGVHFGLFGGAVHFLGTQSHHERFLPGVVDLTLPGCYGMTELGHGSDVASLQTTLTYDPETDEIVVHSPTPSSAKAYIGGAAETARMSSVFGQLVVNGVGHGVHCVLVPLRERSGELLPGISIQDHGAKGGLDGVDNGLIRFDQVRVGRDMLLNRFADITDQGVYTSEIDNDNRRFFTMLGTLVRGRICVGGGASMATRKAVSIATRYALRRRQFGGPDGEVVLLDYLAHQRKLLPAIATLYAFGAAQDQIAETLGELSAATEKDVQAQRELEARAAGLKAAQTRFANDTIQLCREACGGAGYMAENGLTLLRQDADVFATFEGDNTVLLQLVAKGLLTSYQEQFGDLDVRGMVQFAARSFGGMVLERTSARPVVDRLVAAAARRPESETLLDRAWQLSMFHERERHVLETLAARLRKAGKGADAAESFATFNDAQDHVLSAARTHVDRMVLEAFVAMIDGCEDEEAKVALDRLCDLYALSVIEEDSGWFQQHNRIDAARAKAVHRTINDLCRGLRPDALALVEGLGVPESWLGSAMLHDEDAERWTPGAQL